MNIRKQNSKSGFTLAEILVSLAILALLLTSVAVAFNASAINFRENTEIFQATNTIRQALSRITTSIRTAQAVAKIGIDSGDDVDNQQCSLVTANSQNITYKYNTNDNTLELVTNDDLGDADYILCRNVTAISFDRAAVPGNPAAIRNVQISITVSIGNTTKTICTAAVIRKNL